jgi:hypothetical protein
MSPVHDAQEIEAVIEVLRAIVGTRRSA